MMNSRRLAHARWIACVVPLAAADAARACAVCFGNPDHPMSKGAAAGVLVLGGFIAFVLIGMVGTCLFWMQRGRKLARRQCADRASGTDHASGNDNSCDDPS